MDNNEWKTLGEKTRRIVATLENLEQEIKEYQEKNVGVVVAMTNLSDAAAQVASASKELSSAAALFNGSDFSKAMKEIDKRIDKINKAEVIFIDQSKAINNIVENVLTEYKNLSSDINAVNKSIRESFESRQTEYKKLSGDISAVNESIHESFESRQIEYKNLSGDIGAVNESIRESLETQQAEHKNLSGDIGAVNESVRASLETQQAEHKNLSSDISAVDERIREFLEMQHTVDETKELLERISTKIDRIDRNTQKGFRREKG